MSIERSERPLSLDVFRGVTIAGMILVNNPGSWSHVYAPLLHAEWHGWTPTDLIFPFFLFIVGVSITLSRKRRSGPTMVRRSAIICVLGLFLSGYPYFEQTRWRIPGVLQRIAICYFFAAAAYQVAVRNLSTGAVASAFRRKLSERPMILVGSVGLALAVAYWAILMLIPPPGGVAGD